MEKPGDYQVTDDERAAGKYMWRVIRMLAPLWQDYLAGRREKDGCVRNFHPLETDRGIARLSQLTGADRDTLLHIKAILLGEEAEHALPEGSLHETAFRMNVAADLTTSNARTRKAEGDGQLYTMMFTAAKRFAPLVGCTSDQFMEIQLLLVKRADERRSFVR